MEVNIYSREEINKIHVKQISIMLYAIHISLLLLPTVAISEKFKKLEHGILNAINIPFKSHTKIPGYYPCRGCSSSSIFLFGGLSN